MRSRGSEALSGGARCFANGGIAKATIEEERPTETLEAKFQRLANDWQAAVAHHSASRKRENYPAYQQITALGPPVVPLLLHDLETNRRHWFAALTAITGANPVAEAEAGNILKMVAAWLQWGKQKGYQWYTLKPFSQDPNSKLNSDSLDWLVPGMPYSTL